jgi:hypothetical protein
MPLPAKHSDHLRAGPKRRGFITSTRRMMPFFRPKKVKIKVAFASIVLVERLRLEQPKGVLPCSLQMQDAEDIQSPIFQIS